MRQVVNVTHISLDGVMERMEDWHFDYLDDPDLDSFFWESLATCDTLVLGRRTYEGFAEAWPSGTGEIADKLNSMRKYVASTTMTTAEWNNTTVLNGDLAAELSRIKQEPGENIITYGFGPVARTMMEHGLLDEIHIGVNPVLAGKGDVSEMLIREGTLARLQLTNTRPLSSGVVMLSYRPKR